MKENVMDILKYLFESYLDEEFNHIPTDKQVQKELTLAGFNNQNIIKAFQWLEDLSSIKNNLFEQQHTFSNRVYNSYELERFTVEARGFLLYLENKGLLDFDLRETIVEKSLALDIDQIDLNLIQWVVLMVFYNVSDSDAVFTWIEDIIFEDLSVLH
ncbi:MAG: DUF494 domain-containing protein [Pseudomonadota bacterium]